MLTARGCAFAVAMVAVVIAAVVMAMARDGVALQQMLHFWFSAQ
jgi:hypothetical protein